MAQQVRIGSVVLDFRLNAAEFEQRSKAIKRELRALRSEGRKLSQFFRRVTVAATAMSAAFAYTGKQVAAHIDNLAKFSRSIHATVGDFQILTRAAELNGVAQEKLQVSLRRLQDTLGDISAGTAYKQVTDQFDRLNLRIEDIINLPLAEKFQTITNAVRKYIPEMEQATVLGELFGSRNATMISLIDNASINRATKEFEDYGGTISEVAARDVESMNDMLDELRGAFRVVSMGIVTEYAPAIRQWAYEVAQSLKPGGDLRRLLTTTGDAFRFAVTAAAEFIQALRTTFGQSTLVALAFATILRTFIQVSFSLTKMTAHFIELATQLKGSTLAAQGFIGKFGNVVSLARLAVPTLASVAVIYGVVSAAIGLYNRNQQTSIDITQTNFEAINSLTDSYREFDRTLRGVAGTQRKMTEEARKSLETDIERARITALLQEAKIMETDRFQEILAEERALSERRRHLNTPGAMEAAFEAARQQMGPDAARGFLFEDFAAGWKEQVRSIRDQIDVLQQERNRLFSGVDQLRGEAAEIEQRLIDAVTEKTGAGADGSGKGVYYDVWGVMQATKEAEEAYAARIREFRRTFEDAGGFNTEVFDRLQEAKRWHEDITQEINEAGFAYQHLHAVAAEVYEDLKRRAQGMTTPFEHLITIAGSIKDRFQSVSDSIVDRFVDGTTKISDAFKKMAIQIAKDLLWLNLRAGLSRIASGFMGGFGAGGIPVPGASPSLALGNGGTINVSGIPGYANGGVARGWAIVGERGPELAHFGSPTSIYPNGGGGSMAVNVSVNPGSNWAEFHSNVLSAIEAKSPDIVNAANAAVMQNMQRSSNMQDAMRRGI